MKEKDLISSIKNILNSSYIGDDCAYLKDLGIVVTQDSLVEDIHFSLETITPRQLGYKSVMVNVSDIAASGGECKYLTVSLSLPKNVDDNFVSEFYNGAKEACGDGIQIVGGDITGSDKVYISVCAIGKTEGRNISSRSNAKEGYKVVVAGIHGSSAAGLKLLLPSPEFVNSQGSLTNSTLSHRMDAVGEGKEKLFNINASPEFVNSQSSLTNSALSHRMDVVGEGKEVFIKAHLEPKAQVEFGASVGKIVKEDYAMMDTSDGLMDALSTIANQSGVLLEIDFDKIPYDKEIEKFENWQNLILFGGEDYGIVAVVPQKYDIGGVEIGHVKSGLGVDLVFKDFTKHYSKLDVEAKLFNHFNSNY